MCKIAIIPKIKPAHAEKAWQFAEAITPLLTARDDDGFGYMALGPKGLFAERWLNPREAWTSRERYLPEELRVLKAYGGALYTDSEYNSHGERTKEVYCLALHARMATCGINMANVHPFITPNGKTALIHNGVISNSKEFPNRISSCDSEAILNQYVDYKVADDALNIEPAVKPLVGYYACAVLAQRYDGRWILDIFKDTAAKLEAVYVKPLETLVFCTSADMIKEACAQLGWEFGKTFVVEDDVLLRHDAETGEVLEVVTFESSTFDPPKKGSVITFSRDEETTTSDDGPVAVDDYMRDPYYWRSGS